MRMLIEAIIITFILISTCSFANQFVNEGYAFLFGVYCTITSFCVALDNYPECKEDYEFTSITDNV